MFRGMWNLVSIGFVVPIPKFQMYFFMTNVTPVTAHMNECTDEYMSTQTQTQTQIHTHTHTHTHTHKAILSPFSSLVSRLIM